MGVVSSKCSLDFGGITVFPSLEQIFLFPFRIIFLFSGSSLRCSFLEFLVLIFGFLFLKQMESSIHIFHISFVRGAMRYVP